MRITLFIAFQMLLLAPMAGQVQQSQEVFYQQMDSLLLRHLEDGLVHYASLASDPLLTSTVRNLGALDRQIWEEPHVALLINAYNLLVLAEVARAFPIGSVMEIPGFFDRRRHLVAGRSVTLDQLEKHLLQISRRDGRLHFVLVCGALGCPPLQNRAFRPQSLEEDLQRQTRRALADARWVEVDSTTQRIKVTELFRWYEADFEPDIRTWIQTRRSALPEEFRLEYIPYDWRINTIAGIIAAGNTATNTGRYVVSATVPRGSWEHKVFNNLYTEVKPSGYGTVRNSWYTTFATSLYGFSNRFNAGIEWRYRRVHLGDGKGGIGPILTRPTRQGLATIGPKIRWAPMERWPHFSVQSALWFPLRNDFTGEPAFLDWDGPTWWTQFFNDLSLGRRYALFTELSFMVEDLGRRDIGRVNRISTPLNLIGSYFPTIRSTLYILVNYSPFWYPTFDGFLQAGGGGKYQITSRFELELLATWFTNGDLLMNGGHASTWNVGLRYNH
jgi:hypothetical protein